MAYIKNIEMYAIFHRLYISCFANIAHCLGQAGDAGFYFMAIIIKFNDLLILIIIADHMWSWANKGHITDQNIEDLGKLIKKMISQKSSKFGYSFIIISCR